MQGKRIFIFEFKLGPFDMIRFVFFSRNPRLSIVDFKNALKATITKLQYKHNKKQIYMLLRVPNLPREIELEMNKLGFTPIKDYNYVDFNQIQQEMMMGM